jgi:hypothetical protein
MPTLTLERTQMTDVAALPKETLRRVLLKGSIHMIKCLIMAHPRELGAAFLDAIATSVRPGTLRILIEEVNRGTLLTPAQVNGAKSELLKLLTQEHIF